MGIIDFLFIDMSLKKIALSKQLLSFIVVSYLYIFNFLTTENKVESLFFGLWPALLLLFFVLLASLFHRYLFKIFLSFLVLICSFSLFFKFNYNTVITDDIVLSTWINDASLSLEMVSWNLVLWILFTGIIPIFIIFSVEIKKSSFLQQTLFAAVGSAAALALIALIFHFGEFQLEKKGHIRDPKLAQSIAFFSPVDVLYSSHVARKKYRVFQRSFADLPQLSEKYEYSLASGLDDLLVVVIVGETARGDRFGLNGYEKPTSPMLSTVDGLTSFRNVTACDTITISSIKCIFSRVAPNQRLENFKESAFTDVFRSLRFGVDIYSLQGLNEIYSYLGYDNLVSKYAVLQKSTVGARDMALLPYLKESVAEKNKKLVILHTLGSHQTYSDRSMPEDQLFKPACSNPDVKACGLEELSNAYDNSIVATDNFIFQSISALKGKKAVMLYTSDHGESLGKNGIYYHGTPVESAPPEQLNIPLVVWMSPELLDTEVGQKMQQNLQNLDKYTQLSHANFFHSVLGCAGISSKDGGMDESLNLCGAK